MPPSSTQAPEIENDLGMNLFGTRSQQRQEPLLSPNPTENNFPNNNNINNHHSYSNTNENNNNSSNPYVFLQPFRLLPQRDGWGAVADLDVFFTSLYQYYYHRGLLTLILKGIVELVTLFFTLGLSIFLFAYLDWSKLSDCKDETSCHYSFSSYIIDKPFWDTNTSLAWKAWVLIYSLIFLAYGAFSAWSQWHAYQQARASKWFMEEQLGIGERKLQSGAVDWDRDIVTKVIQLQTSGQYRIAIHGQADETLDALVVAQRILRKENFMVALFNNPSLLDWSVPLFPGRVFFSKSLEVRYRFACLNVRAVLLCALLSWIFLFVLTWSELSISLFLSSGAYTFAS